MQRRTEPASRREGRAQAPFLPSGSTSDLQVRHGAGERVPAVSDIGCDLCVCGCCAFCQGTERSGPPAEGPIAAKKRTQRRRIVFCVFIEGLVETLYRIFIGCSDPTGERVLEYRHCDLHCERDILNDMTRGLMARTGMRIGIDLGGTKIEALAIDEAGVRSWRGTASIRLETTTTRRWLQWWSWCVAWRAKREEPARLGRGYLEAFRE